MFTSNGYKWRFIRIPDKRTGSKTTTVCMIKPVGMNIGWARAGKAKFSPNREVVKEFDSLETYNAKRLAKEAGQTDEELEKISVHVTYTDSFNKAVGRIVSLHDALVNMGYDSLFCNNVMDDAINQPEFYKNLPTGLEWDWLDTYLHRTEW